MDNTQWQNTTHIRTRRTHDIGGPNDVIVVATVKSQNEWFMITRTYNHSIKIADGFSDLLHEIAPRLKDKPTEYTLRLVPEYLNYFYKHNDDAEFWQLVLEHKEAGDNCHVFNVEIKIIS